MSATEWTIPCEVLKQIYTRGTTRNLDGNVIGCRPGLPLRYAEVLYEQVLKRRPALVLEIGMAVGTSSLAILSALREVDTGGRLISVDPAQRAAFGSMGLANVHYAGFEAMHTLMEEPDYSALPRLLAGGVELDVVYIDGWHTFDCVLLDLFYCDKLLKVGGVLAFNDCGWRAVHKVLRFLARHRRYEELEVGLPRDFASRNLLFSLIKRIEGRSNADRYFRKLDNWEPPGDFFARF